MAIAQPSPGSPIMFSAGTRAPSMRTSPNSLVTPLIILRGRCSTAGSSIGRANTDRLLVLGAVGLGAGEQEAPVGPVGVARPDLVPADHELVVVPLGSGAQRRQVGAGVGLAEALAPAVAAADEPRQEPLLDGVGPVSRSIPAGGGTRSGQW